MESITKIEDKILNHPCFKMGDWGISVTEMRDLILEKDKMKALGLFGSWIQLKSEQYDVEQSTLRNSLYVHRDVVNMDRDELLKKAILNIQSNNSLADKYRQSGYELTKEYVKIKIGNDLPKGIRMKYGKGTPLLRDILNRRLTDV